MNCKEIIEDLNPVAFTGATYRQCGRPAKYNVKYRSGTISNKLIQKCVCGLHFKQIEKNVSSINKRTGYDFQFEYKKL